MSGTRRHVVAVRPEDVEAALDVLLPLVPDGVHERPAGALRELAWHGEIPPGLEGLAQRWDEQPALDWRDFAPPRVIGGRVAIRAPEAAPAPEGLLEVVIESRRGEFGTGAHPTTAASLELLLGLPADGASFADLGCGAGALAIVAALLGFSPVVAVDVDPASVQATIANAARNGVRVAARTLDLTAQPPPPAHTLGVNVPLPVHQAVAAALDPATETVVASGVETASAERVAALYGLPVAARIDRAGWSAMLLRR